MDALVHHTAHLIDGTKVGRVGLKEAAVATNGLDPREAVEPRETLRDPDEGCILTSHVGDRDSNLRGMKRCRERREEVLAAKPAPRPGHAVDETVGQLCPWLRAAAPAVRVRRRVRVVRDEVYRWLASFKVDIVEYEVVAHVGEEDGEVVATLEDEWGQIEDVHAAWRLVGRRLRGGLPPIALGARRGAMGGAMGG